MAKRNSFFSIDIEFTDNDLKQLFEPIDPLIKASRDIKDKSLDSENIEAYDPIDYNYLNAIRDSFLAKIIDHYFRAEVFGLEKINKDGPAIIGCNHSGTAFPYDAMVLDALVWEYYNFDPKYKFRAVYSPKLAKVWWMRPFGIDDFWRRGGAVDMTFKNFSALLKNGERVLYYPEGVPGIGKGFTRRYQLQHFYSSFVVLAAMHDAPFYPVSCVNAEWVNPTSITIKWIDWIFDKVAGLPFFPIPAVFVGLLFPFFYYLSFPCQMKFFVGEPVDVRKKLADLGIHDLSKATKEDYQKVADDIRDQMQVELSEQVEIHGKKPYNVKTLYSKMKELGWGWIKATPFGWPFAFLKLERDLNRKKVGKIWSFIRDFDIWFFFFPFGWIFLSLSRKFRKQPYGYSDLSRKEWKKKTGSYFWNLEEHPMPSREERFGQN